MEEGGFLRGCLEMYETSFLTLVEAFGDLSGMANEVTNWRWMQGIRATLNNIVIGTNGIISFMEGIAFAIAMAFFLISVIQLAMEEKLTPEYLVKCGAKLAIAVALIMWSSPILTAIIDFGEAFGNMFANLNLTGINFGSGITIYGMNGAMQQYKDTLTSIYAMDENGLGILGFMGELSMGLKVLLEAAIVVLVTMLVMPIIKVCMLFTQITRYIELYVRGAFLPISAALMTDEGWRGPSGRYIRKLLSIATQNAAIFMTLNVTGLMVNSMVATTLMEGANAITLGGTFLEIFSRLTSVTSDVLIIGLVISIAGISFMFKSISVVDDLWGAR